MRDTSRHAELVMRAAIRRVDPVDRIRQALAHSEMIRELALSRLRIRHPHLTTLQLVERLLGERLIDPASVDGL